VREALYENYYGGVNPDIYKVIARILRKEYGVFSLIEHPRNDEEEVLNFFLQTLQGLKVSLRIFNDRFITLLSFKLGKLIQFLEEGDKAKVTLRFRGREMAHKEFGERLLQRVQKDLDAVGVVEQFPRLEGRQMVMVLAPKKKGVPAPKEKAPKAAAPDKRKPAPKVAAKPA
jgi:translation initiation factor IF-3